MNLSFQLQQMDLPPTGGTDGISYFPIPQQQWSMVDQNFGFQQPIPEQVPFPVMLSPPASPNYGPESAFMFPPLSNYGPDQGLMSPPPSPNYGPNEPSFMFSPASFYGLPEQAIMCMSPPPSPNYGPETAFIFPPSPNYNEQTIMSTPPSSPNYGPYEPAFMFPPSASYGLCEQTIMFPSPSPNSGLELGMMSPPLSPTDGPSESVITSPPLSPTFEPNEPELCPDGTNDTFILVLKYLLDCVTTFYLNGEELPYVINAWDPALLIRRQNLNPKSYEYYVPPNVEETDYFGGQHEMWQIKLMQYFGKCRPDIWRMQAVPDFKKNPAEGWVSFTVTTKLRFCCRNCLVPWTSKKGKTVFAFILNSLTRRGWIFMKMYGQVCMRKKCQDWSFQTPACYPEEIDRATHKLCEYISYIYYGIPLDPALFTEVEKSVRVGNPTSQHRKDLCQACQQGICEQGR